LVFQWFFKQLDYKNDFRKEIIQRRLEAYKNIELVIWELSLIVQDGDVAVPRIFYSKENFDVIQMRMGLQNKEVLWISAEMESKIIELNVYLTNLEINQRPKSDADYRNIGKSNIDNLRDFRIALSSIFENDFFGIDNVKRFQNSKAKKRNQTYLVIRR
jgi:hypothetical protein